MEQKEEKIEKQLKSSINNDKRLLELVNLEEISTVTGGEYFIPLSPNSNLDPLTFKRRVNLEDGMIGPIDKLETDSLKDNYINTNSEKVLVVKIYPDK